MKKKKIKTAKEFVAYLKKEYAKKGIEFICDGWDEGMWLIAFNGGPELPDTTIGTNGIIAPGFDGEYEYEEYEDTLEACVEAFLHFDNGGMDSFDETDDSDPDYDKIIEREEYILKVTDEIINGNSELFED